MFRDPPQEKEKNKANNNKAVKFGVKFWEREHHKWSKFMQCTKTFHVDQSIKRTSKKYQSVHKILISALHHIAWVEVLNDIIKL